MPKVTSKLQLTVPKKIADQYGIRPGDELEWVPAGDGIRVQLARKTNIRKRFSPEQRLTAYDEATKRRAERERVLLGGKPRPEPPKSGRGWTREELYDRGFPR
jgi:AbrB family looped-hinge helix DNA binding protein